MMLTAMIWRMESRTVVAAMVGANCSMDETLDAIWAEVTTQSSATLPVLRLIALRAMKNTTERLRGRHSTFYGIQASKLDFRDDCLHATATYNSRFQLHSLSRGKRTANTFTENYYTSAQRILS